MSLHRPLQLVPLLAMPLVNTACISVSVDINSPEAGADLCGDDLEVSADIHFQSPSTLQAVLIAYDYSTADEVYVLAVEDVYSKTGNYEFNRTISWELLDALGVSAPMLAVDVGVFEDLEGFEGGQAISREEYEDIVAALDIYARETVSVFLCD